MKSIEAYIESKQIEFKDHPFFTLLEQLDTLEEISYFVPELTFWAMTFQDILRINEERVSDPFLKKVARHHRLEDAGHEKWFLKDKEYMGGAGNNPACGKDTVAWLYSQDSQITRDAAYAIMAEVYKSDDEILNIILLLTLESSGHIFFEKVCEQVKKTGEDSNLEYFSSSHLEVEMAHALFESAMEKKLFDRELSINNKRKALKMIDQCYAAFSHMFDGLVETCNGRLALAKEKGVVNVEKNVDHVSH